MKKLNFLFCLLLCFASLTVTAQTASATQAGTAQEAVALKNFTLTTPDGKKVSMLDYVKGKKIVLIDFWASWCAPCRKEGKNVKTIYADLHDKGFDVLSVSLDTKREAWLKAIGEEGYKWTQVSDLLGFKSPVCKDYGINAIPALFLVDGQGKLVAKNLRGEELRKKVEEYCK